MPKFKSPTSYTGRKATQYHTGQGKFASATEASAGTLTDVMISPSTLASAVDDLVPTASITTAGIVRLATVAEAKAGASATLAVTPAGLGAVAMAGAPDWSETVPGIGELATDAEAWWIVTNRVPPPRSCRWLLFSRKDYSNRAIL